MISDLVGKELKKDDVIAYASTHHYGMTLYRLTEVIDPINIQAIAIDVDGTELSRKVRLRQVTERAVKLIDYK